MAFSIRRGQVEHEETYQPRESAKKGEKKNYPSRHKKLGGKRCGWVGFDERGGRDARRHAKGEVEAQSRVTSRGLEQAWYPRREGGR